MNRWWRAYDGAVDDPKLQQLSGDEFKAWFNICCLTSANDGNLPPIGDIAFKLRVRPEKAIKIISALRAVGLIDEDETGVRPHNWNARQYKSDVSTERVKRHRERKRNVSHGVSETPPETETDSDTETDISSSLRSDETRAPDDFERFWGDFPNKVGKQAAKQAFEKIKKSGDVTIDVLMLGLQRYVHKTDDRPWCNPATWLNQGRWDDQPAMENRTSRHGKPARKTLTDVFDRAIAESESRDRALDFGPTDYRDSSAQVGEKTGR